MLAPCIFLHDFRLWNSVFASHMSEFAFVQYCFYHFVWYYGLACSFHVVLSFVSNMLCMLNTAAQFAKFLKVCSTKYLSIQTFTTVSGCKIFEFLFNFIFLLEPKILSAHMFEEFSFFSSGWILLWGRDCDCHHPFYMLKLRGLCVYYSYAFVDCFLLFSAITGIQVVDMVSVYLAVHTDFPFPFMLGPIWSLLFKWSTSKHI